MTFFTKSINLNIKILRIFIGSVKSVLEPGLIFLEDVKPVLDFRLKTVENHLINWSGYPVNTGNEIGFKNVKPVLENGKKDAGRRSIVND